MHSFLALSTISALLSTAQALVVHPLPRALTYTTTSHHDCTGPTPLVPFETDAAGRTIRTVTFACATLHTAINPTPTAAVSHGSSGALHNSDAEDHHGAVKRAGGSELDLGNEGRGVGEPHATRTLRKRCWPGFLKETWFCNDDATLHTGTLTSDVPSATAKAKRRDLLQFSREALPADLSAANQGAGVKERDNLSRDVDNQDKEREAARILPRSPKKHVETEEERKAREAREAREEEAASMANARSLTPPTNALGHSSARDVDSQDKEEEEEEAARELPRSPKKPQTEEEKEKAAEKQKEEDHAFCMKYAGGCPSE